MTIKVILKSISTPLLLFFLFILIPFKNVNGEVELPSPTNLKYVNDYENLLDIDTKEYIISVGNELENKTGAQAVIVIVNSLEGNNISDYGNKLFRNWGIGQKDKNNGLLILLSMEDRKWRVEVGRGLEGAIPDILSNRVMESAAVPEFKNNNYGEGLRNTYSIFADMIAKEYGVTLEKNEKINYDFSEERSNTSVPVIAILGLIIIDIMLNRGRLSRLLLDLVFWSSIFGGKRCGGGRGGFNDFGGFGGGDSGGGGSSGDW